MACSITFSSNVLSSKKCPAAGHMGFPKPPEGPMTRDRNVRFRRCFKVRAMQASVGAEPAISGPDLMKSKNLYEVLKISPAATAEDIKRAYRRLAREFHPDHAAFPEEKNRNTQLFLQIHNAYVTLSDPHDRARYDRQLWGQVRGLGGKTWGKARLGYRDWSGRVGRNWETDQCW